MLLHTAVNARLKIELFRMSQIIIMDFFTNQSNHPPHITACPSWAATQQNFCTILSKKNTMTFDNLTAWHDTWQWRMATKQPNRNRQVIFHLRGFSWCGNLKVNFTDTFDVIRSSVITLWQNESLFSRCSSTRHGRWWKVE